MAQQQIRRDKQDTGKPVDPTPAETRHDSKAALKEEIDDLLDEIDAVLEHNAADFVRQYVQKGGE